jgi:D-alanine--poly(phosphoribitol) ligase subunit 1
MRIQSPQETMLWHAFAATARRRGDAVALDFGTATVSFRDLAEQAGRASAWLTGLGVGAGDVVGLQIPKRGSTYALILGCLRIGAIYAPLDPRNPQQRTERMLGRLKPKLLVTSAMTHNPFGRTVATLHDGTVASAGWPVALDTNASAPRAPTEPAYIMHTSGSTGEPKGAVIPQRGVLSLMRWSRGLLGDPDQQRFSALNPLHFDNSVFDIYCGLVAGATLVPIETADMPDPAQWVQRLNTARASVLFSVPTLLLLLDKVGSLTPEALPHARTFVFGGEGFPIETLRAVHSRFGSAVRLINVYGPTETSCICSSLELDTAALAAATGSLPSLGRMHADFSHLVLDDAGRPVGAGATGELWIGGPNVGLGYFANREETDRRFRQDPRQDDYRSVYYRSGDLVREDKQGLLWFQGRADNQIKIAGHRVELEEIDGALEAQPGVGRALTVLSRRSGTAELVTAFETRETVSAAVLMTALAARLPHYMRPARLIELQKLPLNANGKVDRRAVQALADAVDVAVEAPLAPQTTEARVRAAWAAALGHAAFTNTDSFFDLGGTSLALTRVHAALSAQFPDAISMLDLFANPTIARTVQFLDGRGLTAAPRDTTAADRARRQQEAIARARGRVPGGSA